VLLLAHTGITLALTRSLEKMMVSRGMRKVPDLIDYRLVLVGSMLPDIIDKPLGGFVLRETIGSGRIYSHTLLFLIFLFGIGMFFWYKFNRSCFLVLAGGSFFHHILDGMWLFPGTFLWPAYGWGFPEGTLQNWLLHWMQSLLTDPYVYVPEIIGGMIIIFFVVKLTLQKRLLEFFITGKFGKVLS
jgi:hypothetical protein